MIHKVEVEPERVTGWFSRFAQRNGGISHSTATRDLVTVTATNGTVAAAAVPFGPLVPPADPRLAVDVLALHLLRPRRIGLLLVRLGGHSIGIAANGKIVASRTDRRPVHARASAGGQSPKPLRPPPRKPSPPSTPGRRGRRPRDPHPTTVHTRRSSARR